MKILVINSGSSSLKYQLFDMDSGRVLAKGNCERIGAGGRIVHKRPDAPVYDEQVVLNSHDDALELVLRLLADPQYGVVEDIHDIDAVGHRIAHGGEKYKKSTLIDDEVVSYLETIVPLNPLHGPPAMRYTKKKKSAGMAFMGHPTGMYLRVRRNSWAKSQKN